MMMMMMMITMIVVRGKTTSTGLALNDPGLKSNLL